MAVMVHVIVQKYHRIYSWGLKKAALAPHTHWVSPLRQVNAAVERRAIWKSAMQSHP